MPKHCKNCRNLLSSAAISMSSWTDNDVYDPKRFVGNALTRPEVRQKLTALGYLGFYDAFRALHPDSSGYTFGIIRAIHSTPISG